MVRFKNRYLLVAVELKNNEVLDGLPSYAVAEAIKATLLDLYGEVGAAVAGNLLVKYYSPLTGMAIVRIGKDAFEMAWNGLFFTTLLRKRQCAMRVVHVSGTIKLLQKHAVEYDRRKIQQLRSLRLVPGLAGI
ncbi:hypothetical protein HDU91_005003 [Kappamyces sp. JEL0680]|nr:hypothetical protein HDU91_005003 [Kappamyces sp. JEL0680]